MTAVKLERPKTCTVRHCADQERGTAARLIPSGYVEDGRAEPASELHVGE
jgi:hypothetical protein